MFTAWTTFIMTIVKRYLTKKIKYRIATFHSTHIIFKVNQESNISFDNFQHPNLTQHELQHGCKLGIDSWADTSCSGKHAHVLEFIEGKTVTATGFSSGLGSLSNLPIANVAYAHDLPSGETIILQINNTIYLGSDMDDSLLNPIQCMENDVHVDLRPRKYYPNENGAQTLVLPDGLTLNIQYQNSTPFVPVRRPTPLELTSCHLVEMTSHDSWDPQDPNMNLSIMSSINPIPKPSPFCNLYPSGDKIIDQIPFRLHCN